MFARGHTLLRLAILAVLLISAGPVSAAQTRLRVALFPYIPDAAGDHYASLLQRIEVDFERANPGIDLILRPLNRSEDFYDIAFVKSLLTGTNREPVHDVIEVDTVILGDLVSQGLLSPWPSQARDADWFPVAERAVLLNETVYGVPHLLCGFFIFGRAESVTKAQSVEELIAALDSLGGPGPHLAGDFLGSWEMTAAYLDAWVDTYPDDAPAAALAHPADAAVVEGLRNLLQRCSRGNSNPCLTGEYHDNDSAPEAFARGRADTLFGYSEGLHAVLSAKDPPSNISVESAPLGHGNHPLLFTDALTIRDRVSPDVAAAALQFAKYLNSPATQEMLLFGLESPKPSVPTYLLPATRSAFKAPRLHDDPFYRVFRKAILRGSPFPNVGVAATRKRLRDEVLQGVRR